MGPSFTKELGVNICVLNLLQGFHELAPNHDV